MASLGQTFDVNSLPEGEGGDYSPLPEGWYTCEIDSCVLNPTKDGTGEYLKLRYNITGPSHQGRVVFGNINLRNKSDKAEAIGLQQLRELLTACGLKAVNDTDQFCGHNISIKLKVKPATDQYPAGNEVRGFKALEGRMSAAPAPIRQQAAPTPSPAGARPPWAK